MGGERRVWRFVGDFEDDGSDHGLDDFGLIVVVALYGRMNREELCGRLHEIVYTRWSYL
jgi:hypothetical protein